MARKIRKMQVAAYAPVELGVQAVEYSGVEWSVVKTMGMDIISSEEPMFELKCIDGKSILFKIQLKRCLEVGGSKGGVSTAEMLC